MRLLRSLFLLATCSTSLAFSAITRMHTARVSSWRRQHAATKAQLDHNGSQEFGVQKKRKPARMTRGRAHKVVREKDKFAMEDVRDDRPPLPTAGLADPRHATVYPHAAHHSLLKCACRAGLA